MNFIKFNLENVLMLLLSGSQYTTRPLLPSLNGGLMNSNCGGGESCGRGRTHYLSNLSTHTPAQ